VQHGVGRRRRSQGRRIKGGGGAPTGMAGAELAESQMATKFRTAGSG
jgi:hypothetical protein